MKLLIVKSIFCLAYAFSCTGQIVKTIEMKQNKNKALVLEFYKRVIGEQDLEYASNAVTDNYIQHNPMVKTGKVGFLEVIQYLKQIPKPKNPPKPFIRVIAEGDFVVMHLSVEFAEQKKTVLEIFRVEDGLLAEHWDAIEDFDQPSKNGNSVIEGPTLIEDVAVTEQNKKVVAAFISQVLLQRQFNKIQDYMDADLIQHNPEIANGITALQAYYQDIKTEKVYRIIGEGNFVVTQAKSIINSKAYVVYDIYRLANGIIQEHWSVKQIIPEKMAHNNGMI